MDCSERYPAVGVREHVVPEISDEAYAELDQRACPECDCRQSKPVQCDNGDDQDVAKMPLRVCVACEEVFGFDDSTLAPQPLTPRRDETSTPGGIWNDYDDGGDYSCYQDAELAAAMAAADWDDEVPVHHHRRDDGGDDDDDRNSTCPPQRERARGRRGGGRGWCGHGHETSSWRQCGRGQGRRGRGRTCCHRGKAAQTPSNGGGDNDPLVRALGAASGVVSGGMEPVGRIVGTALGSVAGDLIGSPRAGVIGADMGSTVGRGVAEMLKDSKLCNQQSSS